jgi:hypothetical protein
MESTQKQMTNEQLALPLGLRYNLGVADSVPSNRNLAQFLASNASTFTASNNVCRINVSSGQFLDLKNAVLQYDLKNTTGTDAIHLDGGADCVIQRIRIVSSDGSEIERLDSYNLLTSVIDQYTTGFGTMKAQSALKGGVARLDDSPFMVAADGTGGTNTATAANGLVVTAATGGAMTISNASGGKGYDQKQNDRLNTAVTRKYTFGLKGGFFNPTTAKLLPPNTPFQLEITFDTAANCLVNVDGSNAVDYEVTNCELHCPAVTINDPAFMARMNERMAQGISYRANTYQHFVNTTNNSTGKDTIQIGARCRSLKGLMSIFRRQALVSNDDYFKLSRRTIQYIDDYQYKVGSQNYPIDRVNVAIGAAAGGTASEARVHLSSTNNLNISEAYSQALRLTGNLNVNSASTCIGVEAFCQSEINPNNGVGIAAIDLSAYSDGSVNSGLNTLNNMPISLEITKSTAAGDGSGDYVGAIQIDCFSVCELLISRLPSGVLMASY